MMERRGRRNGGRACRHQCHGVQRREPRVADNRFPLTSSDIRITLRYALSHSHFLELNTRRSQGALPKPRNGQENPIHPRIHENAAPNTYDGELGCKLQMPAGFLSTRFLRNRHISSFLSPLRRSILRHPTHCQQNPHDHRTGRAIVMERSKPPKLKGTKSQRKGKFQWHGSA